LAAVIEARATVSDAVQSRRAATVRRFTNAPIGDQRGMVPHGPVHAQERRPQLVRRNVKPPRGNRLPSAPCIPPRTEAPAGGYCRCPQQCGSLAERAAGADGEVRQTRIKRVCRVFACCIFACWWIVAQTCCIPRGGRHGIVHSFGNHLTRSCVQIHDRSRAAGAFIGKKTAHSGRGQ
jgi:hypothetical protein